MYSVQDRDEAKRQLTAHQKIIEKHKEMIQKCINFTKMLLVEKVSLSCCCLLYYMNLLTVRCQGFLNVVLSSIVIFIKREDGFVHKV